MSVKLIQVGSSKITYYTQMTLWADSAAMLVESTPLIFSNTIQCFTFGDDGETDDGEIGHNCTGKYRNAILSFQVLVLAIK